MLFLFFSCLGFVFLTSGSRDQNDGNIEKSSLMAFFGCFIWFIWFNLFPFISFSSLSSLEKLKLARKSEKEACRFNGFGQCFCPVKGKSIGRWCITYGGNTSQPDQRSSYLLFFFFGSHLALYFSLVMTAGRITPKNRRWISQSSIISSSLHLMSARVLVDLRFYFVFSSSDIFLFPLSFSSLVYVCVSSSRPTDLMPDSDKSSTRERDEFMTGQLTRAERRTPVRRRRRRWDTSELKTG